ncbi:MAG: ferritin [bacterium]|nr:ferritin [bacterium]
MLISENMAAKLNEQTINEFNSYWIYLAMAFKLDAMGFKTFAQWFHLQADEEKVHAMKFAHYILEVGADVSLIGLDKPKYDYKSVQEIVEAGLEHEMFITRCINDLADLAAKENDHATKNFLQWFVEEQVEEVATASDLLSMVKMAKDDVQLLLVEQRIMELRGSGGESA